MGRTQRESLLPRQLSPRTCADASEGEGASWRCGRTEVWKDGGGVTGRNAGALGWAAAELLGAVVESLAAAVWLLDAVAESLAAVVKFLAVVAALAPPSEKLLFAVAVVRAVAVWPLVAVARPLAGVGADGRNGSEGLGLRVD
jgi:hypothetical protein